MELEQFKKELEKNLKNIDININDKQAESFYKYMNELIEENKKVNLTAITDPKDIILKHFVDSLTINRYLTDNSKIIDVGTGAGFPGIPNAIYRENLEFCLLDSLKKRVEFLNKIKYDNNMDNIENIWGRAEDIARIEEYREMFDVAVSRAVAPLSVLIEYLIPFVKVGGKCICMKGPNYKEEMKNINTVLEKIGAEIEDIKEVEIKDINRYIIIIKKTEKTNPKYPRKAGIPTKKPLG